MKRSKLVDIAEIRPGYLTRSRITSVESGSCAVIQIKDFDDFRTEIDFDKVTHFDPPFITEEQVLKKGEILFLGKGRRNFAFPLGAMPYPSVAASYFFVVRPDARKILPEFLAWCLNQPEVMRYLHKYTGRSVHMPVVSRPVLEKIQIPVLPLEVQQKIVALDRLMTEEVVLCRQLHEKKRKLLEAVSQRGVIGISA